MPSSSPVSHSRQSTRKACEPWISPRARPRMIVPTVWLPALPPVPIMSGMKSIRSGRRSCTPLKKCETYLVMVPARNRKSSQPIRRRTPSTIRPCQ